MFMQILVMSIQTHELQMTTKPGQKTKQSEKQKQLFPTYKCVISWFNIE
jgi:hypothetical protein